MLLATMHVQCCALVTGIYPCFSISATFCLRWELRPKVINFIRLIVQGMNLSGKQLEQNGILKYTS
jgi:hypothetical protein